MAAAARRSVLARAGHGFEHGERKCDERDANRQGDVEDPHRKNLRTVEYSNVRIFDLSNRRLSTRRFVALVAVTEARRRAPVPASEPPRRFRPASFFDRG